MPRGSVIVDLSASGASLDKREFQEDKHFRWEGISKFVYYANAFSFSFFNFDMFSRVTENAGNVFDFMLLQVTIGITYMCMDLFIKQYTRKMDFSTALNPLLKAITIGVLLQSALFTLLHARVLADAARYLILSLQAVPAWSSCHASVDASCVSANDMIMRCRQERTTELNITSAHYNYLRSFTHFDKGILTTRIFVVALIWICNFLFSTVADHTLLKFFKVTFLWRTMSTIVTSLFLLYTSRYRLLITAIRQILDVNTPSSFATSMNLVSYVYGIGLVGVYDFGTLSPYLMLDNAIIIFSVSYTAVSIVRSIIVRLLYLMLVQCVDIKISITTHYMLFAVLPLSMELLHIQKLYAVYLYLNLTMALVAYLVLLTLTMSKLLHSEFQSIKMIYIVGILCFLGFGCSLPFSMSLTNTAADSLVRGLNLALMFLGGCRVAIIMWIYGIQRFVTDIHFWLGYKPTKFWTTCWALMPIFALTFFIVGLVDMISNIDEAGYYSVTWIGATLVTVVFFTGKTIMKYLMENNFVGAFKSSRKYGPIEPDDRRRRKNFDESTRHRKCKHDCIILDDLFDCNHMPLMYRKISGERSETSNPSFTNIYNSGRSLQPGSTENIENRR